MTNMTLPYSAKKKCIIKMGQRQVTVSSACLCPWTQTMRVITVGDIIKCLNTGANVKEIINDNNDVEVLSHKTFANIFSEEHLDYLKKFNSDIRTPVIQRESYLIDIPVEPVKTEIKKNEEPIIDEVTVEEPAVEDAVVELTITEEVTPIEEVQEESIEEPQIEEAVISTEETPVKESIEEEPKYNNYNNKKNKHRR